MTLKLNFIPIVDGEIVNGTVKLISPTNRVTYVLSHVLLGEEPVILAVSALFNAVFVKYPLIVPTSTVAFKYSPSHVSSPKFTRSLILSVAGSLPLV